MNYNIQKDTFEKMFKEYVGESKDWPLYFAAFWLDYSNERVKSINEFFFSDIELKTLKRWLA